MSDKTIKIKIEGDSASLEKAVKKGRLNCKNPNCKRATLELGFSKNNVPVIRVKQRHDSESHISEFDFEELNKEFEKMRSLNLS